MSVIALGYIGLGVSDLDAWRIFSEQILGTKAEGHEDGLRLRIDSRAWRIQIQPTGEDDIIFAGWEVSGPRALDRMTQRLLESGVSVDQDDGGLAAKRGVKGVVSLKDPSGLRVELYWGATECPQHPFFSPCGVRGFVTGDQGLGHIVVAVDDADAQHRFYSDLLGFGVSDHIDMRFGPDKVLPIEFMHCNPRHHSFAFAPLPSKKRLLHFMLQTDCFDDVGFALDRVAKSGVPLAMTLGRHVNDEMVSFYAHTPSGFEVEYGWGAKTVDTGNGPTARYDAISSWGHAPVGEAAGGRHE